MDFYDQDRADDGLDELDFVGSCDCCPDPSVGNGILLGLAWGTAFLVWMAGLVNLLYVGQYTAFAAVFIAGFCVFVYGLFFT